MQVATIETIEVSHTSVVSGVSKFISLCVAISGFGDGAIDEIRQRARYQHHDAHHELNTSGFPRLRASSCMSRQKEPSSVFDNRQARTQRLYQSMMAARYMKPRASGT